MFHKINEIFTYIFLILNTYLEKDYSIRETYYLMRINLTSINSANMTESKNEIYKYKFYFNLNLLSHEEIINPGQINLNQLQIRLYPIESSFNSYEILNSDTFQYNQLSLNINKEQYRGIEFFYMSSKKCDGENFDKIIFTTTDRNFDKESLSISKSSDQCDLIKQIEEYDKNNTKKTLLEGISIKEVFQKINYLINSFLIMVIIFLLYIYKKKIK